MDAISKLFEHAGKYSWVGVIVLGSLILAPDDVAKSLHLADFLTKNIGLIWIGFSICLLILVQSQLSNFGRFVTIPIRKIFFPQTCIKSGIIQSRMRQHTQMFTENGQKVAEVVLLIGSNGSPKGFFDGQNRQCFPLATHSVEPLSSDGYQCLSWWKIDWTDIFNGDATTGTWGIEVPKF